MKKRQVSALLQKISEKTFSILLNKRVMRRATQASPQRWGTYTRDCSYNSHVPAFHSFTRSFRRKTTTTKIVTLNSFARPQRSTHQTCNLFLQHSIYSGRRVRLRVGRVPRECLLKVPRAGYLHLLGKVPFCVLFFSPRLQPFPQND